MKNTNYRIGPQLVVNLMVVLPAILLLGIIIWSLPKATPSAEPANINANRSLPKK